MKKKTQLPESKNSVQKTITSLFKKTTTPDNEKILIAGNEHRFNNSLQQLLLLCGYKSHMALTELETVTLLDQNHFGLIILNLKLIEIHGHNMMEQVKSKRGRSKLIMLSHDSIFDMAVWALRQGADDFFRTPYSPDELLLSINNLLSKKILNKERRRNHAQLIKSEVLHRYMVNNSPDIIYLLDKDGKFSFFNRQIEPLLGFSTKELLGTHYSTLIHPEDLEKSRYVFRERRTGQRASKNVELRLLQKKNSTARLSLKQPVINIELHATGVYKNCKKSQKKIFLGTYGVVRDISQRKITKKQFYHQLPHYASTNLPNQSLLQDRTS